MIQFHFIGQVSILRLFAFLCWSSNACASLKELSKTFLDADLSDLPSHLHTEAFGSLSKYMNC